uniref:Uncharacterized protein n=1 Tax=Rhizophora mucronata TaxID=61149 RepID=A0A2P2N2Z0_RHIMU
MAEVLRSHNCTFISKAYIWSSIFGKKGLSRFGQRNGLKMHSFAVKTCEKAFYK